MTKQRLRFEVTRLREAHLAGKQQHAIVLAHALSVSVLSDKANRKTKLAERIEDVTTRIIVQERDGSESHQRAITGKLFDLSIAVDNDEEWKG